MDLNFPRPMLNSPAESGVAAGNAFYASVVRRAHESRERRVLLNEVLSEMYRHERPDYAEIVSQINLCLAEIRPERAYGGTHPNADKSDRGDREPSEKAAKDAASRSLNPIVQENLIDPLERYALQNSNASIAGAGSEFEKCDGSTQSS
jgi:hypothetical protein